jgi:4-amino-4-deoxy-L-arabinose transferase-like glycosyltransferase
MNNKKLTNYILIFFISVSFIIKLIMILIYKNQLTLSSDDLNYIKSAVVLVKRGIFIFYGFNDPTVFVMPGYPFFLAGIFKLFGFGLIGIQAVRILQAAISCITILMVFLTARTLFNRKIGLIAAFLVSFYPPNIITSGYILTETIFTAGLITLIYFSIKFSTELGMVHENRPPAPFVVKFIILSIIWTIATLIRPTMALYPLLLFFYLFIYHKYSVIKLIKIGTIMLMTFVIIILPWWIRNYSYYGEFIPLSASSGNPMLQGTYVRYKQTPENIVYYKLGKNTFETNKIEVETAKKRMASEFKKDFFGYLGWFTIGKTIFFWATPFYWKAFFNIRAPIVFIFHYIILLGFLGIASLIKYNFFKFILPISVILYFNVVHCYYMAFDRYAFPLIPLLSIFSALILSQTGRLLSYSKH